MLELIARPQVTHAAAVGGRMTRRYVDRTSIRENQTDDLMRRRHWGAADRDERCDDARARGVDRPHQVADGEPFDGHVTARRRDPRPAREADRARRRPARVLARDGDRALLVDGAVDAASLLRRVAEDREEVEPRADLIEAQRVEHLPVAIDRELLIARVRRCGRDPTMREARAERRRMLLDS